jgi:hypothetical protein
MNEGETIIGKCIAWRRRINYCGNRRLHEGTKKSRNRG